MSTDSEYAAALGEVKGLLQGIQNSIAQANDATNRRIDDLRQSIDGRFKGHDERIQVLESNERTTAIRAAGSGAGASVVITIAIEAIKAMFASGRHP